MELSRRQVIGGAVAALGAAVVASSEGEAQTPRPGPAPARPANEPFGYCLNSSTIRGNNLDIPGSGERAHELLTFAGVTMFEADVIGVLLPDTNQPHTSVLGSLMSAELNVQYVYPLMYRKNGRGAVAIYVSEKEEALRVLRERNYELVTEDDLMHHDEFF